MEPRIQYCTARDGVRIAYWRIGQGDPLIMTPNNGYSHIGLEWRYEANRRAYERLATRRTLVRYDGRGAGLSQRDAVDFSIEARGLDLEAVVGALDDAAIVIVALGNYGPAAVRFTSENPSLVSRLVLYDSYICKTEVVEELSGAATEAVAGALAERDLGYLGRTSAAMMGADPDWYASYLKASISPAAFKLLMQHLRSGGQDCSAWVSNVGCPCLVIHEQWPGEDSQYSMRLATALPDAQLAVIERRVSDPWGEIADMAPLVYRFLGLPLPEVDEIAPRPAQLATVLFTDIVGHTAMMSRLGDERGREVLREHERITRGGAPGAWGDGGEDDGGRVYGLVRVGYAGGGVRGGVAEGDGRAESTGCSEKRSSFGSVRLVGGLRSGFAGVHGSFDKLRTNGGWWLRGKGCRAAAGEGGVERGGAD